MLDRAFMKHVKRVVTLVRWMIGSLSVDKAVSLDAEYKSRSPPFLC